MYDLYLYPTPNGLKPLIMLEELGVPYQTHLIHIGRGEQFEPAFLKIAPNNRIPAMVDNEASNENEPLPMFESGLILQYLAEKHNRFLPTKTAGRVEVLTWLYWQMGGLGPMLGQNHHFVQYAPEKIPYGINRYVNESKRLYGVLNHQIGVKDFICAEYSIADMACYPWCKGWEKQMIDIDEFPNVKRWLEVTASRDAVVRAYQIGEALTKEPTVTAASRELLFNQDHNSVKR